MLAIQVPELARELLGRAGELRTIAARHAERQLGSQELAPEVWQAILESGLLRAVQPKRWGGWAIDPGTYTRITIEIAKGDPSAAWVYSVLSIHHWMLAYAHPQFQEEYFAVENPVLADSFRALGRAVRVEGGYVLSGYWRFVSGAPWASWFGLSAVIPVEGFGNVSAMFFVPRQEVRVEPDWEVVGLSGTGSQGVRVEEVFVPEHRVWAFGITQQTGLPGIATGVGPHLHQDDPLFRVPFMPMLATGIYPAALGGALGVWEEVASWLRRRVRPGTSELASEAPGFQRSLAEALVQLEAAQALSDSYAHEVYKMGWENRPVARPDERSKFFSWRAWIVRTASEVAHRLFLDSGGNSLYLDSPIQRLWRDTAAAAQHAFIAYEDAMRSRGQTLVGLEGHPYY